MDGDNKLDDDFSLGEEAESDEWDYDMCSLGIMNSKLYSLQTDSEKYTALLNPLFEQVDKIQGKQRKTLELAKIIEEEVKTRQTNKRRSGRQFPDSGWAWHCVSCCNTLASKPCPKLCPMCEEEITNPVKVRLGSDGVSTYRKRPSDGMHYVEGVESKKKARKEHVAKGLFPPGTHVHVSNCVCVLASGKEKSGRGTIRNYDEEKQVYVVDTAGREGGLCEVDAKYLVERNSLDTTDDDNCSDDHADASQVSSTDA